MRTYTFVKTIVRSAFADDRSSNSESRFVCSQNRFRLLSVPRFNSARVVIASPVLFSCFFFCSGLLRFATRVPAAVKRDIYALIPQTRREMKYRGPYASSARSVAGSTMYTLVLYPRFSLLYSMGYMYQRVVHANVYIAL